MIPAILICVKNNYDPASIKNDNGAVIMRKIRDANRTKKPTI